MRRCAFLAAFLATASRVAAHPLCYVDSRPTDLDEVLTFCPAPQAGACCTDVEEAAVEARFDAAGPLTGDCEDLYKQVRERDGGDICCAVLRARLAEARVCTVQKKCLSQRRFVRVR